MLKFIVDDGAEGLVDIQSIISASLSSAWSSSIRSFARFGPDKGGDMRDGRPKMGFGAVTTTGVDDRESAARRSGSVAGRGAGDERALVFGEGVNVGSDGNLWEVESRSRMEGGCCNRSTKQENKKI